MTEEITYNEEIENFYLDELIRMPDGWFTEAELCLLTQWLAKHAADIDANTIMASDDWLVLGERSRYVQRGGWITEGYNPRLLSAFFNIVRGEGISPIHDSPDNWIDDSDTPYLSGSGHHKHFPAIKYHTTADGVIRTWPFGALRAFPSRNHYVWHTVWTHTNPAPEFPFDPLTRPEVTFFTDQSMIEELQLGFGGSPAQWLSDRFVRLCRGYINDKGGIPIANRVGTYQAIVIVRKTMYELIDEGHFQTAESREEFMAMMLNAMLMEIPEEELSNTPLKTVYDKLGSPRLSRQAWGKLLAVISRLPAGLRIEGNGMVSAAVTSATYDITINPVMFYVDKVDGVHVLSEGNFKEHGKMYTLEVNNRSIPTQFPPFTQFKIDVDSYQLEPFAYLGPAYSVTAEPHPVFKGKLLDAWPW